MTAPRLLWTLLFVSWCSAVLGADPPKPTGLDPEADKPYHLRVVLGIAEHRLLTPVFQEQVERELGASLQAAFGDLAVVEVTRKHPRLKEVLRDGLGPVLDAWQDVEPVKTHFVLIDYNNGAYEIQTRQHDGLTGQASPVVRHVELPDADRQLVARTAALLVSEDFGIVGTFTPKKGSETVEVTLQGSSLGVPLDRWIKQDDVLIAVQIAAGGSGQRANRVPWTLLRVDRGPDNNGVCVCQVFYRTRESPLVMDRGILGYRCLRLTASKAPLRVRLVQSNAKNLLAVPTQRIDVRRQGFRGEERTVLQGATDPDGFFSTEKEGDKGQFEGVAFVSVMNGNTQMAKLPLPIVDDRLQTIPVNIGGDEALQLTVRRDRWLGQVYESVRILVSTFKELEKLLKDQKRSEALRLAKEGLSGLQEDLTNYRRERDEMLKESAGGPPLNLGGGETALKQLDTGKERLRDLVGQLGEVVGKENDPKRRELQSKVTQAQLLEGEAEYGKALELYEQVLAEQDNKDLRDRYTKLKQEWQPRSEKHRQARDFIYNTWPALDALKLLGHLDEARDAFKVCEQVGDTLGPAKLLKAASEHAGKLQERVNALKVDESEDDRATAKIIAEVADGLTKLIKDVQAYLEAATKK
jgi:hypothetical protein